MSSSLWGQSLIAFTTLVVGAWGALLPTAPLHGVDHRSEGRSASNHAPLVLK